MTNASELKSRIRRMDEIPTLPVFFNKIMETLECDRASAADLSRIIEQDPALMAKIFRLSNSAYYGRFKKVATINQAVTTVGFNEVKAISLGIAVFGTFSGIRNIEEFWLHAMSTAAAVRLIGERNQETGLDKVYSGGLLHDVGKLVMTQLLGDKYLGLAVDGGDAKTHLEAERSTFGADHAQVGRLVAERWHFPAELVELISSHHFPLRRSVLRPRAVATVFVADYVAHLSLHEGEPPPLSENEQRIFDLIGITTAEVNDITEKVRMEQERIIETFALVV